jgi:heme/copper-type cytochrome/quinol oxidase subunit 4
VGTVREQGTVRLEECDGITAENVIFDAVGIICCVLASIWVLAS